MDLNCGRVPVGQEVLETLGPATPKKSITMKRTVVSVINSQGIPAFESLMDVPVALLAALPENSGSSSPDRSNNSLFAPITPGNKKSVQHCNPQEVGQLVIGDLDNKERSERSIKVQTEPIGEQMKLGVDNGLSSLVAPPTPYKTALFQHANSSLKGASPQNMGSGKDEETQGINLNKTPKKNVKRKKHRPKVIKEGKPTKSMQPITPITGENKEKLIPKRTYVRKEKALNSLESPSPCITESNKEKPNLLKTYVRKRKVLNSPENPSDRIAEIIATSSSRNVKTIDELRKSSTKSVRRSLNFNSEDEAKSSCHVTTNSGVESELWETLHGSATVCSAEFKAELTEGLGVIATKPPVGVAFDLNRSLNQVLDKYIKLPVDSNPAPSAESFGREIDVSEHLKGPIRTIDAENNMDMQSDHDMVNPSSHPDVIVIDDGTQKSGIKEHCNHIKSSQDSSESPGDECFVGAYNDPKQGSLSEKISGLCPYLPVIHKKRRTERHTLGYDKAVLPKLPRCLTFADAQRPVTVVGRLQQSEDSELMIAFDPTQRPTRKRSKLSTHARKPTYIACAEDSNQLLGSGGTKKGSYVRTESRNCVPPACPPACMDALFADTRFKITTKKRRKKGHFRLVSSALSDIKQEYRVDSSKLCFLGQPFVLGLTASLWKNLNELQDFHRRGSNIRTYFHANFQPRAVVPYMDPYMDPVEVIAQKMRNLKINGEQTRHADEAKNALVPYCGRKMMVPYGHFLDIGKKQRPRAKVDLDPETNRVWNLLMGKKNNVETDEVDMDKEKWWEEEREVFHGRADAFIARMHLILGDRRFTKWKGSVVDSVVGVFLTQNVSDHLSSSAFMSLAARFPLWSGGNIDEGNDKTADAENVNTSKKQGDGRTMQAFTVNGQQKMLKAIYASSTGPYARGKETADGSCSCGSNKVNEIGYSKGKCLQFQGKVREVGREAPQNRMQTSVLAMQVKSLEESEDRMTSGDVFVTQESVSSLEDLLEYQIQTAGEVGICSEAVSTAEDLVIRSKQNSFDSPTSFIEYTHDGEIRSHESYATNDGGGLSADHIGASDQEVACMKIKKRITLADKLCGLSDTCLSVNTSNIRANHVQHVFEDTSPSSIPRRTQSSINTGPHGTANADKVLGVGRFVPSASLEITKTYDINIIERTGTGQGMLLNPVSAMASESHVSRNQLHLQTSACAEIQQCVEKHVGCHDSLTTRKTEKSLKDVSHKLSYAFDEQSVDVQPEERDAHFPAEKTCQEVENLAETQHCGEQRESLSSCNDLKETPETAKVVQLDLENEGCCLEDWQPQNGESSLRSNTVNPDIEKKKTFDWEDLRKEALANGADNERSSETKDSLDWEAVRNADVNDISKTIRERGMNNVLAQRIKDFLNRLVKDHGSIDLEWLRNIPPDKAKDYLLSIRGLGLKSVECVRLLTLHHLAFPVDTNVGRICVRLGWVPLQPLPESLQLHLLELYPMLEHIQKYLWPRLCTLDQRTLYELHYQMITFGKVFCTKTKPNCNACPMRGECKHFASAFASARLALPGPEEKGLMSSRSPSSIDNDRSGDLRSIPLRQLDGIQPAQRIVKVDCEPIVEEPASPVDECVQMLECDIEDAFYEDSEEIPTIRLSSEEFKKNLMHFMQENNTEIQDEDMSKALVAITAEAASIPMPKLKNVSRLRTEHQVYELPDAHPLLKGMDHRIPDDPCPYLLAIWTPGETAQSTEPPESCCNFQDSATLCDRKTCFACNSKREAQAQTVRGTILIPCRTAMKGSFPLNGTYFQVNEVFADHSSSCMPIDVPTKWIWNLPRRTVFFGTSIPTIFKGLTMEGIQHCFWRGFVCVRGFDRVSRAPKPLYARLHFPPSKAVQNRKAALKEQGNSTSSGV